MIEESPQNNIESEENINKQEKIAIALELSESTENFPFPGLSVDAYADRKKTEEEYPGYSTPIDELIKRFQDEGMKVVLGSDPKSGNVFVIPQGSADIVNDGVFLRHLSTTEDMDERLLDLILKD